ncbi:MAG: hypothetical protein ACOX2U_01480 [Limisphaerales bacterium]|jgi:TolB protein|nr:hypothetical protein [Verrucomicrobiota bacterium]
MQNRSILRRTTGGVFAILYAAFCFTLWAQTTAELDIDRMATLSNRPFPVHIKGSLSPEALSVLRFDLEVGGCDIVSEDAATYLVHGASSENITGRLTDQTGSVQYFNRSYKNGTTRAQAHALAGDILKVLTGQDSIFNCKIAYCVNTNTDKNEIFISDFDGFSPKQVTRDGSLIRGLSWGAENKSLLYCSYMKGNPDIYLHNLAEGRRSVVANYTGLNTSPAISPDGKKVAMILSKDGTPDVYVSNLDGSNLKRITQTAADEASPCWSPDGTRLCFSSRISGSARLYTAPAEGGKMQRITTTGVGSATEPDWSPDGKWIAFTTTTRHSFQICVVPAAGGIVEILAEGESPSWAPNSRTLIFCRKSGKKSTLVMLDVPTKKSKTITNVTGSASQPCWTR